MPHDRPEALRFLVLADLVPDNDLGLVLEAFSDFARWHPSARLVVVGEGPERDALERSIGSRDLSEQVGLLGAVVPTRLVELLQRTDVFMVPRRAGCPQSVPAALPVAMAGGLCVIASEVGPVSKLLHDGRDGLLVPPGDQASLLRAMHLVADHVGLRTRLGQRAAEAVRGTLQSA